MNFTRAVGWSLLDKVLNVGARALQTFALARLLGVTRQGQFALFMGVTNIAAILANAGLAVATNYFAAARADVASRAALLGTVLTYGTLTGLVAGIGAAGFTTVYRPFVRDGLEVGAPILVTVLLTSLFFSFSSFLFGCARYDYKAACNLVYQLVVTAALVLGARTRDVVLVSWVWTGGMCLATVCTFVAVLSQSGWRVRLDLAESGRHVVYGLRCYAFVLTEGALRISPLLIVGHLLDAASAAVYAIASSCSEVSMNVARAFADVIQQRAGAGHEVGASMLRVVMGVMTALAVVAAPAAYVLVPRIFGADYAASVVPLWILLAGLPFLGWGHAACSLMFGRGQPGRPGLVSAGALLVGAPLTVVLTGSMGVEGAALATATSYLIVFALSRVALSGVMTAPPGEGARRWE